jgi:hypothetical protein
MFVHPKNNQGRDQQLGDELDCYNQVQQQTSIPRLHLLRLPPAPNCRPHSSKPPPTLRELAAVGREVPHEVP